MTARSTRPDLEPVAARELSALLQQVPIGGDLRTAPYANALVTLEYLMTAILRFGYPEWSHEDIDGLALAHAVRSGEGSLDLLGTCILITDQRVTPFALEVTVNEEPSITALRLRLGEPGTGQLGISGPACESTAAGTLRMGLPFRADVIVWAYEASWPILEVEERPF